MTQTIAAAARLGEFVASAAPPRDATAPAASAFLDTVAVALGGAIEPASRIVQKVVAAADDGTVVVWGTGQRASATGAALANGTAAHALDYDDMCFVSLAHPSAPLVPAVLAAAALNGASGRAALDGYVVGFEIEGRLGRLMNPRHYERGWHCTSTLGTIGAAAAASRVLGLDSAAAGHALAIAASEASGLKENFGTMVKPLHAGLAARNGVLAALLAKAGMTASGQAIDGPQGFLHVFGSAGDALDDTTADLGVRWELLETGITVKLYPSCAGTHPSLDAILDLRREQPFSAHDVEQIEIDVDSMMPNVLIYPRPLTALEGKFSMPFCAALAVVDGRVGIDTFDASRIADPTVVALMRRVDMQVDPSLDSAGPPLTQARLRIRLRDGRVLQRAANGARGYPQNPPTEEELAAKFLACATRVMTASAADRALALLRGIADTPDTRTVTEALTGRR